MMTRTIYFHRLTNKRKRVDFIHSIRYKGNIISTQKDLNSIFTGCNGSILDVAPSQSSKSTDLTYTPTMLSSDLDGDFIQNTYGLPLMILLMTKPQTLMISMSSSSKGSALFLNMSLKMCSQISSPALNTVRNSKYANIILRPKKD